MNRRRLIATRSLLWVLAALPACKDEDALDPEALPPPASLVDALERDLMDVDSPAVRARVLVGIADAEVSGGAEAAKARLTMATVATREVSTPSEQASLRTRLVELWCRAGDVEQARVVAEEIPNPDLRAESQVSLAGALARTARLEAAEAVARSVKVGRHRGAALLEVVRGHLAAGQRPAAGRLVAAFEDRSARDEALAEVAIGYAKVGALPQVRGALDAIASPHWRGAGQAGLALAHWRRGKRRAALAEVERIESEWMAVRALAQLYGEARRTGKGRRAARLLRRAKARAAEVQDALMRSSAYAEIVGQLGQAGQGAQAEALLDAIPDRNTRRKCEAELVEQYALAGDFEAASRVLEDVEVDALWGAEAAVALARALAEAGEVDRALRAVERARASDLRLPALGYVAGIQAAKGAAVTEAQLARARALLAGAAGPRTSLHLEHLEAIEGQQGHEVRDRGLHVARADLE